MERLSLGWDLGLRLLAGFGGASRGAGGFSGARNPEPPRNFGSDCISSGRAGAIPGRRLRTNCFTRWLSVPCSRCSARWPGSPYSAPRRPNGSRVPGTPPDGEVGMREETETLGKAEGVNGDGGRIRDTEGQKREEMKEKDE